ncbi:MAG: hydrogenase formation protein HypD, partial [Deltaproteobacteria bacterium]|nr:hydrogenase formation protein HypD [Deltaproteobacteria bacterium]
GCPVCVTPDQELAALLALAGQADVILASFGDMLRTLGPDGRSLKHARAQGAAVEIVYSPLDALRLATKHPGKLIVFAAAGFETTAPSTAATVIAAQARGVDNFRILCCHKTVPPAIRLLLADGDHGIDALLLPGHVATVLGMEPFAFIPETAGLPAAVAGFEPIDLIAALELLLDILHEKQPRLVNAYSRAVAAHGNSRAREMMMRVFEPADAIWRGLGLIPGGGLRLRDEYAAFDAATSLGLDLSATRPAAGPAAGCRCGEVLRGRILPPECPLFGTICTPASPVGPCMVSNEGGCAAWHAYGRN